MNNESFDKFSKKIEGAEESMDRAIEENNRESLEVILNHITFEAETWQMINASLESHKTAYAITPEEIDAAQEACAVLRELNELDDVDKVIERKAKHIASIAMGYSALNRLPYESVNQDVVNALKKLIELLAKEADKEDVKEALEAMGGLTDQEIDEKREQVKNINIT